MRPTRAEINTASYKDNIGYIRKRIGDKPIIMAVVKANAYGHGLEIITKAALETGEVQFFGVATEEEGIALRKLTDLPILVLTTPMPDEIDIFLAHGLDFTLSEWHM